MNGRNDDYELDNMTCPFQDGKKCTLHCALLLEDEDGEPRCSIRQTGTALDNIANALNCIAAYGVNTYEH